MGDKPLVTYGLICYRQERYIRQAVQSALDQTYTPLQVVISDDASPDGTFDEIKKLVDDYTGPHRIVLNRNPTNVGLTGNVNRLVELAEGELILIAAGDDYSLPERTEITVDTWLREGRPRGSICTGYRNVNAEGELWPDEPPPLSPPPARFTDWFKNPYPLVYGASHAFHPDLYRVFGPLKVGRWSEDMPLAVRALALDGVYYTPEPLVCYRRHGDNLAGYIEGRVSWSQSLREECFRHRLRADVFAQVLEDLDHPAFDAKWGRDGVKRIRRACRTALRRREVMCEWLSACGDPISWKLVAKAWAWPPMPVAGSRLLARRLLPRLHSHFHERHEAHWARDHREGRNS